MVLIPAPAKPNDSADTSSLAPRRSGAQARSEGHRSGVKDHRRQRSTKKKGEKRPQRSATWRGMKVRIVVSKIQEHHNTERHWKRSGSAASNALSDWSPHHKFWVIGPSINSAVCPPPSESGSDFASTLNFTAQEGPGPSQQNSPSQLLGSS
ncbi:hypothetical protein VUR80DRAFT_9920 [Thermomyces stellatus]